MALTKEQSAAIVSKFGANDSDTGNTKVQVALMTERIKQLTVHCTNFPKDTSASRGLLKIIGQRRKLLKYLIIALLMIAALLFGALKGCASCTAATLIPHEDEAAQEQEEDDEGGVDATDLAVLFA